MIIAYDEYERLMSRRERPKPALSEYLLRIPRFSDSTEDLDRITLNLPDSEF